MSVAEWPDTYGIPHWRILRSSYRNSAWVEFESTTTDTLADWAIRPWLYLHSEPTFCSYSNFIFCSVFRFHFGYCLSQSPPLFYSKLRTGNHMIVSVFVYIYIYMYIYIYIYIFNINIICNKYVMNII